VKLALVGSGEYLPPMEPVDRFLLGQLGEEPQVVCLPTAAGRESPERIAYWMNLGQEHFTHLGVHVESLPVIDLASANDPAYADAIRAANWVYLSGGWPTYLQTILQGSLVWSAIEQVLARGGLLSGCSAGAMIMGERFIGFPGWHSGFGFLPRTVVIPHFEEVPARFVKIMRTLVSKSLTLFGVEGNTALFIEGAQGQVIGSGGVTVWNQYEHRRYVNGQAIYWSTDEHIDKKRALS